MGVGNCLFLAGENEILCTGTGIHWPKNNK